MSRPTWNRQTILLLALAAMAVLVAWKYGVFGGGEETSSVVAAPVDSIPAAEKRLEVLRRKAALVPGREAALKQVQAVLAERERAILTADTGDQAKAHLLELMHTLGAANGFDASGAEQLPQPKALGKDYGQVSVSQQFVCGIDQLVNFLAAIGNQPEALATENINISNRDDKNKTITVRLTLTGVVPKKLVPEKKGLAGL